MALLDPANCGERRGACVPTNAKVYANHITLQYTTERVEASSIVVDCYGDSREGAEVNVAI
jgi:hypothetical protein